MKQHQQQQEHQLEQQHEQQAKRARLEDSQSHEVQPEMQSIRDDPWWQIPVSIELHSPNELFEFGDSDSDRSDRERKPIGSLAEDLEQTWFHENSSSSQTDLLVYEFLNSTPRVTSLPNEAERDQSDETRRSF